jgi:hypothetical protein
MHSDNGRKKEGKSAKEEAYKTAENAEFDGKNQKEGKYV